MSLDDNLYEYRQQRNAQQPWCKDSPEYCPRPSHVEDRWGVDVGEQPTEVYSYV